MISRKNKTSAIGTDTIKMEHNGSIVDIQKVLQLDPGEVTEKEVFPPPATRLRIRAPYWDENGAIEPVAGEAYDVSLFDVTSASFQTRYLELEITVWPKTAGWKLSSSTGVNLGIHEGVTYYGDQTLLIDSIDPLDAPATVVQRIEAIPHKGDLAETAVYTFKQTQQDGTLAVPVLEWNFTGSTTDTTGTYEFTNIFQTQIEQVGENPYQYTNGSKQYDRALMHYYSGNIQENGRYTVDISNALPADWFTNGMSISTVWYSGNGSIVGLKDQMVSNNYSSNDLFISASYGFKSISGVPGVNQDYPSQFEERIVRKWEHIALTVENLGDLDSNPQITWGFRDGGSEDTSIPLLPKDPAGWYPVGESANAAAYESVFIYIRYESPNLTYAQDLSFFSEFDWFNEYSNPTDLSFCSGLLYKTIQNGVQVGEAAEVKPDLSWNTLNTAYPFPGNGILEIKLTNDTEDQDQAGFNQAISGLKIYSGVISTAQCSAETLAAGLLVGEATSTETFPRDPLNARTKIIQNPLSVDYSYLNLKTWMLDDQTVVLGVDPLEFFQNQVRVDYPYDGIADKNYHNGYSADWGRRFIHRSNYYETLDRYQPRWIDQLDDAENYVTVVNTSDQSTRTFSLIGRHSDIISPYIYKDGWKNVDNTEVSVPFTRDYYNHVYDAFVMGQYAFLKLDTPLADGESIDLSYSGNTITATYDRNTISHAIKVNQVGYPQYDVAKTAYVGRWLGMDANNPSWDARAYDPTDANRTNPWDLTFHIVDAADVTSTPVYTGTATVRQSTFEEDIKLRDGVSTGGGYIPQTGEKVWQLSFDDFNTAGEYQIYIPNMGYSWPFKIGDEATLKSFYTHMRGLWHHRSGDGNMDSRYTAWEMPNANPESWEAQFPAYFLGGPGESYGNGELVNASGIPWYTLIGSQFGMAKSSSTGKRFRDVKGGYRDAADLDRRTYHERICRGFLEIYLHDPSKFTDGQLNLHESGDGIPDIVKMAEWAMEIWRRTQRENGAVSMWCETDHHESYAQLKKTPQTRYYLAEPDCYTSLMFAQNAAMIARAYRTIDSDLARRKATQWTDAAVRAFEFGHNPANVPTTSWYYSGQTWTYTEDFYRDKESAHKKVFPAAAALYKLTGDVKYVYHLKNNNNWDAFKGSLNNDYTFGPSNSSYETMFELQDILPEESKYMRDLAVFFADIWLWMIENHNAYRQPHFSFPNGMDFRSEELGIYKTLSAALDLRFSEFTQYGGGHIDSRASLFVYSHMITGDRKYLDFMQRQIDFINGATPSGITETTGIGKVNPIWGLQGQQFDEFGPSNQAEPIPGISFYNHWQTDAALSPFTGVNRQAWTHNIESNVNTDFVGSYTNMIPGGYRDVYGANLGSSNGTRAPSNALKQIIPKWRPHWSKAGAWYPISGEYTVWETIYQKAVLTGYMLESNNTTPTDPNWLMTKETERENVEGWFALP